MDGIGERLIQASTVLAALAAVVVAGFVVTDRFARVTQLGEGEQEPLEIADWYRYAASGRRVGASSAVVTIVEFGDYECPACKDAEPHLEAIRRRYPENLTFVYRHWPLSYHRYAYQAARAAECAGAQDRFWEFHRHLYSDDNWFGDAMIRFARQAGVPRLDEFRQCFEDSASVPAIEADMSAAKTLGAPGTPALIVNGRLLRASFDSISLSSMIEELLVSPSSAVHNLPQSARGRRSGGTQKR